MGGSVFAMAKSNRLAADLLRTKRRRAEETEERAARLQSNVYTARCSHHQSLRNCSTRLVVCPFLPSPFALRTYIHIYIYIYIHSKISNRTRSLASLRSFTLAARQLFHCKLATFTQFSSWQLVILHFYYIKHELLFTMHGITE